MKLERYLHIGWYKDTIGVEGYYELEELSLCIHNEVGHILIMSSLPLYWPVQSIYYTYGDGRPRVTISFKREESFTKLN